MVKYVPMAVYLLIVGNCSALLVNYLLQSSLIWMQYFECSWFHSYLFEKEKKIKKTIEYEFLNNTLVLLLWKHLIISFPIEVNNSVSWNLNVLNIESNLCNCFLVLGCLDGFLELTLCLLWINVVVADDLVSRDDGPEHLLSWSLFQLWCWYSACRWIYYRSYSVCRCAYGSFWDLLVFYWNVSYYCRQTKIHPIHIDYFEWKQKKTEEKTRINKVQFH